MAKESLLFLNVARLGYPSLKSLTVVDISREEVFAEMVLT